VLSPYSHKPAIDAIAITHGPGLDPCLWTGVEFAKDLANKWNVPLVPIDHMEGHLLVGLLQQTNKNDKFQMTNAKTTFPAIALLVSGGHSQLVLMKGIGKYKVIGETRDDAAGECFDKTARVLGLPYPGGPAIAAAAAKIRSTKSEIRIQLPRPMMHTKDYDFSFSGLKTAVLYDYQSRPKKIQKSQEYIRAMAKEIQQAIIDVLIAKTLRAAYEYNAKSIVLGGGVAANRELRRQLRYNIQDTKYPPTGDLPKGDKILVAPPELCTDNGLMPALAGFFNLSKKKHGEALNRIAAKPNLRLN
jgi:N6-L-threonylcarbamoyladenine synthase